MNELWFDPVGTQAKGSPMVSLYKHKVHSTDICYVPQNEDGKRIKVLEEALGKAADTFRDIAAVMLILGKPLVVASCAIAEEGCRAALV